MFNHLRLAMQSVILAYSMFFVSLVFYSYQFIARVMQSIVMDDMMTHYGVSSTQIGQFGSIYYAGYAIAHIPIGFFVDRFGARIVMAASSAMIAVGMLPMVYTKAWPLIIAGRLLVGIGSVASVLGMFKLIRIGFGEKSFGFYVGITLTAAMITVAESNAPIARYVERYGMNAFNNIILMVAIATTLGIMLIVPQEKKLKKLFAQNFDPSESDKKASAKGVYQDFARVIGDYRIILISVIGGLMVGIFEGFADAWGPKFLQVVYGMSKGDASFGAKSIYYGVAVGSPLLGYILQRTGSHIGLIFWSAVGMLISMVFLMSGLVNIPFSWFSNQFNLAYLVLFVIGGLCGYQVGVLGGATSMVPTRLFSMANATANMIMMGFGVFFHNAVGIVICSQPLSLEGEYTSVALQKGIAVIPAGFVAAIALIALLKSVSEKHRVKQGVR